VTRLVNPLMMQIQAITVAMLPVMSRQFVGRGQEFRFTAEKTLKYVAALGIPMAIGAFLLSERTILLLYGNEFRASIPALQILAWTLAISALTSVVSCCAVASGKVVVLAAFNAVAALGNVGANLLLIPRYSFRGAAAATAGCEVVLLAVFFFAVWRSEVARFPFGDIGKIAVAAVTMGVFVFLCRSASFFIVVPGGVVIYCGVLLLLRFMAKEEKELLRSVLRRA
jgi:O-antigen/teichoic acid export membrane protein